MDEATKQKLRKLFIAALEEEKRLQEEALQKLWDESVEYVKKTDHDDFR